MDEIFQKISLHHEKELPFVAYRKPNETQVQVFLQKTNRAFYTHSFSEEGFVFAPFDLSENTLFIPKQEADVLQTEIQKKDPQANSAQNLIKGDEANREAHLRLVEKGVNAIKQGKLKKVVLSRQQEVSFLGKNPAAIFQQLLANYPTAFVYCWYHPKTGCWLGATPETLVSIENKQLKTMALAGTQTYDGTTNVAWGEKEKEEQRWVTDSITADLQGLVERLHTSPVKTIKAGNLLHLQTDISGVIDQTPQEEIIRNLHPTPAVCGFPKKEAKDFILKEEGYDRSFYTGFLGEMNLKKKTYRSSRKRNQENRAFAAIKTHTHLFVNLRCMKVENDKAQLFIGGGITVDSVPQDEWQETVNKAQTMLKVL